MTQRAPGTLSGPPPGPGMTAPAEDAVSTRDRIVVAASRMFRTHGVTGTGLREVVARAGASRGSLQHYFPGGKDELITEAVHSAGDFAGRRVRHLVDRLDDPTPGDLFAALVGEWRDLYLRAGYAEGCPLAAATADTVATAPGLRAAIAEGFARWQRALEEALVRMDVPAERAPEVATLMMVGLEGALIVTRGQEDAGVIDVVIERLRPVLDAEQPGTTTTPAPDNG